VGTLASVVPPSPTGNPAPSWAAFRRSSGACAHAVRVYSDVDELVDAVTAWFEPAFAAGDPSLIVATHDHLDRIVDRFDEAGWDAPALQRNGLLAIAEADATLERFMVDGFPRAAAFDEVVGGVVDELAARHPGREVRVFGEMVDLLRMRGQVEAAISLEELWNSLAWSRSFSLLCAYEVDVFDRDVQADLLPAVCAAHSHVVPAADAQRFARAVDGALEEVLGPAEAGKVYVLVGDEMRLERVPVSQLVLMWLSSNMPGIADRVLAAARERYLATT
jgi:hypothetical protein